MLILDKDNIISYLQKHMPEIDFSGDVSVIAIGDGSQTAEDDGDGYVNFLFIVKTNEISLAVKQSRELSRVTNGAMTLERNHLEYDAMKLFNAIAPDYVPAVYFIDDENRVFVMEDASVNGRKISRFQLNQNRIFPELGKQCGEYLARTAFYTSEFYLPTKDFRQLTCRFMNEDMRPIMEEGLFLTKFGTGYETELGQEFYDFAESISEDPDFYTERHKLRYQYMTKAEGLIHADLHTSNLFTGEDSLKVIDMEFTFCGPFSYDIGYLMGNLISQYTAACYRDFPSEKERLEFKAYLLKTILELYHSYVDHFIQNWNQDAKDIYKNIPGLQKEFEKSILLEAPGYASIVNWFRVAGKIPYPDFDTITDLDKKRDAMALSLLIDWQIMFHRYEYKGIEDLIEDILFVEQNYSSNKWKEKAVDITPAE